jgi:DDE superfamily endonuclease
VNGETFLKALQHFVNFAAPSKSNPHLFLLDNHSSHLEPAVIYFPKENGIVMLSFPLHCSHRLQPLDVSDFGPFKTALKQSFNDWLQTHPGRRISIHEVTELTSNPYLQKMTPSNICSGFAKAGIHPFNRNIFTEQDFFPALLTDRQQGRFFHFF